MSDSIMVWKMEASFRLGRTTDLAGVDSVPTVTSLLCLQPDHYQLVLFMAEYMDLAYPPEIGRLCGRMLVAFWVIHVFFLHGSVNNGRLNSSIHQAFIVLLSLGQVPSPLTHLDL